MKHHARFILREYPCLQRPYMVCFAARKSILQPSFSHIFSSMTFSDINTHLRSTIVVTPRRRRPPNHFITFHGNQPAMLQVTFFPLRLHWSLSLERRIARRDSFEIDLSYLWAMELSKSLNIHSCM